MTTNAAGPSRLTVERETIRQWAAEHGMEPVRTAGTEGRAAFELRPEGDETMERLSWDEFFEQIDEHELVVVHHGESDHPLEVVTRSEATNRVSVETSEFEARLVAGETITTELDDSSAEPGGDVRTQLRDEDEGKAVVGAGGGTIGIVERVHGNRAHINPEAGIVSKIRSKLGWGSVEEADYTIDESNIERITDDEVELTVRK